MNNNKKDNPVLLLGKKELREAIGRIIYGDGFAPGHDYDDEEKVFEEVIDLIHEQNKAYADKMLERLKSEIDEIEENTGFDCMHSDVGQLRDTIHDMRKENI